MKQINYDIKILDNYVDDREFRNYIHGILIKHDFKRLADQRNVF